MGVHRAGGASKVLEESKERAELKKVRYSTLHNVSAVEARFFRRSQTDDQNGVKEKKEPDMRLVDEFPHASYVFVKSGGSTGVVDGEW